MATSPEQGADRDEWDRHYRAQQLYRSLVETLPYRDSQAISQRTINLLNDAQPYLLRRDFYRVLFTLAPQPGNRLNGQGLHRYLLQVAMPERDSDFGFATSRAAGRVHSGSPPGSLGSGGPVPHV